MWKDHNHYQILTVHAVPTIEIRLMFFLLLLGDVLCVSIMAVSQNLWGGGGARNMKYEPLH